MARGFLASAGGGAHGPPTIQQVKAIRISFSPQNSSCFSIRYSERSRVPTMEHVSCGFSKTLSDRFKPSHLSQPLSNTFRNCKSQVPVVGRCGPRRRQSSSARSCPARAVQAAQSACASRVARRARVRGDGVARSRNSPRRAKRVRASLARRTGDSRASPARGSFEATGA